MSANKFIEEKYGLHENPFLEKVAMKAALVMWVNRKEQLDEWQAVVSNLRSPRKNYIVLIVGDYGEGKTQSLLKIVSDASQYTEIYPAFFTFRGEQRTKAAGLEFMFRIFKSIDFKRLGEAYGKKLQDAIEAIPDDLDEVKAILRNCCSTEQTLQKMALYFLRGEIKPTKSDLKQLGIIRKIDDIDVAKEYLAGILNLLKTLGFKALLLAVDELEYLFSLVPKPQQSIYIALLRGLYDFPMGITQDIGDVAKVGVFLAVSTDGYRRLKQIENEEIAIGGPTTPLLDRIDVQTNLGVLTKEYAKDLVVERLHYNRVEGRYADEPLIPFDPTFIDFIWKITQGNPRDIIEKCSKVIDAGIEKGVVHLDRKTAEALLRERKEL